MDLILIPAFSTILTLNCLSWQFLASAVWSVLASWDPGVGGDKQAPLPIPGVLLTNFGFGSHSCIHAVRAVDRSDDHVLHLQYLGVGGQASCDHLCPVLLGVADVEQSASELCDVTRLLSPGETPAAPREDSQDFLCVYGSLCFHWES